MLIGGPQPGGEDVGSKAEWKCDDYRTGQAATAYTDQQCSYATNEVAINWNAPLAYLAGALEALNAGHAPEFAVAGIAKNDTPASSASVPSSSSVASSSSSAVSSSATAQSSSNVPQSSSSANQGVSSSSKTPGPVEGSSSSATAASSSSKGSDAIGVVPVERKGQSQQPRLRFDDQKLFIEKNGKRFDLKGHRIK